MQKTSITPLRVSLFGHAIPPHPTTRALSLLDGALSVRSKSFRRFREARPRPGVLGGEARGMCGSLPAGAVYFISHQLKKNTGLFSPWVLFILLSIVCLRYEYYTLLYPRGPKVTVTHREAASSQLLISLSLDLRSVRRFRNSYIYSGFLCAICAVVLEIQVVMTV